MHSQSVNTPQLRPPSDWRTFAIWQYDWRNEPIDPAKLQRQVEELSQTRPDAVFRGWFKWASDLDYSAMAQVVDQLAERGIGFIGGITCAAITEGENGIDTETFTDLVTRDAHGRIPRFGERNAISHVSWANPKVAEYLADCALRQVEAGAQALHLDEIWVLGSGASAIPNEGFDDYAMAAFRDYLKRQFPDFTAADWKARFDIDSIEDFNYRAYLQQHRSGGTSWADDPDGSFFDNPLAPLWKTPLLKDEAVHHRWFEPKRERSFHEHSMLDFGGRLCTRIREGAERLGRPVALAHNGPWPGMDFQNWNVAAMPEGSREAVLRPLHKRWKTYRSFSERWSPPGAPRVAFIDWPGEMPAWLDWPRARQEAYLRTIPFEARVHGVHFAYHLRNFWPGSDARENGLFPLMAEHCRWFSENRERFPENGEETEVRTNHPEVQAVARRAENDRCFIYLTNFALEQDAVKVLEDLFVHLPDSSRIAHARLHAPASEGGDRETLPCNGTSLKIEQLAAFAVIETREAGSADN